MFSRSMMLLVVFLPLAGCLPIDGEGGDDWGEARTDHTTLEIFAAEKADGVVRIYGENFASVLSDNRVLINGSSVRPLSGTIDELVVPVIVGTEDSMDIRVFTPKSAARIHIAPR